MNERTEIAKEVLIALITEAAQGPSVARAAELAVAYTDALLAELAKDLPK